MRHSLRLREVATCHFNKRLSSPAAVTNLGMVVANSASASDASKQSATFSWFVTPCGSASFARSQP